VQPPQDAPTPKEEEEGEVVATTPAVQVVDKEGEDLNVIQGQTSKVTPKA
jgi:hypothetical protein